MFFIHATGRRNKSATAATLDELGEKITALMASQANDAIVVAIGKTDQAVMPYVWIRRDSETDEWEGELGDSIKLGIEEGLLHESDPIQIMSLREAIAAGVATVEVNGIDPGVEKLQNEKNEAKAKRMIDDLFRSLEDERN